MTIGECNKGYHQGGKRDIRDITSDMEGGYEWDMLRSPKKYDFYSPAGGCLVSKFPFDVEKLYGAFFDEFIKIEYPYEFKVKIRVGISFASNRLY